MLMISERAGLGWASWKGCAREEAEGVQVGESVVTLAAQDSTMTWTTCEPSLHNERYFTVVCGFFFGSLAWILL